MLLFTCWRGDRREKDPKTAAETGWKFCDAVVASCLEIKTDMLISRLTFMFWSQNQMLFFSVIIIAKGQMYTAQNVSRNWRHFEQEKKKKHTAERQKLKTITKKMVSRYYIVSIITSLCLTWRTLKFPNQTPAFPVTSNVPTTFRNVFLLPSYCAPEPDPRMFSMYSK